MTYKDHFKQKPHLIQWVIMIAALLAIGGIIGSHLYWQYESTRDHEEERLRSVVRMLDSNITQNLTATKNVLLGLRQFQSGIKNYINLNERLQALTEAMPGVRTLLILDAEGNITASNRPELVGRNFSHRDYFSVPQKNPDHAMFYVSPPFITVLGVYTLNISITISGPRGEFAGVISAALEPAYFEPLLESVVYAPDMWSVITHRDGTLFMMIPDRGHLAGKKLPPDSPFYQHQASDQEEFIARVSYETGEERILVGHAITTGPKMDVPLFVAASRDNQAVFAAWREFAFKQSLLYGLIVLVSIMGLGVFQRRMSNFNRLKKQMEDSLKEAEKNYRSLAENAADGILISADDEHIIFANRRAADITGYSVANLLERGIGSLIDPEILAKIDNISKNESPADDFEPLETVIDGGRGKTVPVEITSAMTLWERKPARAILLRDITARKIAEEKIAAASLELERSNKDLDDFAYIASHDLKEPLRGIHNYARFLLEDYEDKLDDEAREKLKTLAYLAKRMDGFIEDLLTFSRVNKLPLAPVEANLNFLVKDALTMLTPMLERERVEVLVPKTLPSVRANEKQVVEVFQNLIANAIKYNDKTDKRVEIGFRAAEEGPTVFYVRDNGIGIDAKFFDSIFKIFKRLHPRDKFGGGSGAGLTIVKKIVERHGGKIWLESAPGCGTTFYFTLEGDKHGH